MNAKAIQRRLEYLREQIKNECISYDEIAELASLAKYIDPDDVQLLEWAGVPEFEDEAGGCIYDHDHAAEPEKCEWHN